MVRVLHPRELDAYRGLSCPWIYADSDRSVAERVASRLSGEHEPALSPRQFQDVAASLREAFCSWVDQVLAEAPAEAWLITPLHRDPRANNLFVHLCWLKIIDGLLVNKQMQLLVISNSLGFARSLRELCRKHGVKYECRCYKRLLAQRTLLCARAVMGSIVRAIELFLRMVLARCILGSQYPLRLENIDFVLGTFVHDGDIRESGEFFDRYFLDLAEWYEKRGLKSAIYPKFHRIPLFRYPSVYRGIARSKRPFIAPELFLTLGDIACAGWVCLRGAFDRVERNEAFLGLAVGALIKCSKVRYALASHALVTISVGLRRLRVHRIHPKKLLLWYENQPEDKAIHLGFRFGSPECQSIAVRQVPAVPNLLSFYITTQEAKVGVSPNQNWVCGRNQVAELSRYDTIGQYRVVPALRYQHLYLESPTSARIVTKDLIVLLTASVIESLCLVCPVAEAMEHLRCGFTRIVFKLHPDLDLESFRTQVEQRWPQTTGVVWFQGRLSQLFDTTALVVSGGTSAALEAVCRGLPVIIIGWQAGVDVNPLEGIDSRLWQIVYDAVDLIAAVRNWRPTHPMPESERRQVGEEIRDDTFLSDKGGAMTAFLAE